MNSGVWLVSEEDMWCLCVSTYVLIYVCESEYCKWLSDVIFMSIHLTRRLTLAVTAAVAVYDALRQVTKGRLPLHVSHFE